MLTFSSMHLMPFLEKKHSLKGEHLWKMNTVEHEHRQFHTSAQTLDRPMSLFHISRLSGIQFYRNSNVITNAIRDASILFSLTVLMWNNINSSPFHFYCFWKSIKTNWKNVLAHRKSEYVRKLIRSGIAREELADWKRANNRHQCYWTPGHG